ncbi:helix-turn-helix domain-containing protein [Elstera cyanobacteriorum]|uniref:helix-turn-helix domain-containing protein n=1 Tax=Elstera cyanobacteriorum TaxID=2022747 RepID=UPI0023543E30|nr:helix-turn-helix domain-containing protein [Elstera cyanobacteriorum]MCK6442300.1 helix-turn-helix domain-containing protein [Elstera cyanobacteriorum]
MTTETRALLATDLAPTRETQAELLSGLLCDVDDGGIDLEAFLIQLGKLAQESNADGTARGAGVSRTSLHQSLSGDRDPRLSTIAAVLATLGLALAVVPRKAPEAASDAGAYDRAHRRLAAGDDELIPFAVTQRLLAGENPVRVWREHRGQSAEYAAEASGLSLDGFSRIEAGQREGTISALRAIARLLNVSLDDLAPPDAAD